MKLVTNYLKNNIFFYRAGKLWQLASPSSIDARSKYDSAFLPIVIIAREHYQEINKVYPIPDKRDVFKVIENEFKNLKMASVKSKDLTSSLAKLFIFDEIAENFIDQRLCLFLPETYLVGFLKQGQLTTAKRCESALNLIRKGKIVHSSATEGLYQNPEMFLFSSGVGEADSRVTLSEEAYFQKLLTQIGSLRLGDLPVLVAGQKIHQKLFQRLHVPSLLLGGALSILVYLVGMWGEIHVGNVFSQEAVPREEIRKVIKLKQELEDSAALIETLSMARSDNLPSELAWELVALLLENNVSISVLIFDKGQLRLGLLAPSSTEAIEVLRQPIYVSDVVLEGDIMEMDGKQQFTVIVEIQEMKQDV